MPVYTKSGARILFVHIPKTGGSSIEKYLRDNKWTESHHTVPGEWKHATWEKYDRWGNFDYKFTVIRDPVERFKSDILHLSKDIRYEMLIYRFFGHHRAWNITDQKLKQFLNKMTANPTKIDNHIRPQSDFLKKHSDIKLFKYPGSIINIPLVLNAMFDTPLGNMPHLKKAKSKNKPVFTKAQEDIIKQYYKKDYKRFF